MKTKPFNIEEAKAGAKVVTRDGRNVRIIAYDRKDRGKNIQPIIALIEHPLHGNIELMSAFGVDGKFHKHLDFEHDLFLVDESMDEFVSTRHLEKILMEFHRYYINNTGYYEKLIKDWIADEAPKFINKLNSGDNE